jgi:tight adherence protein B
MGVLEVLLIPVLAFICVGGLGLVLLEKAEGSYKATKRAQVIGAKQKAEKLRRGGREDPNNRRKQILQNLKDMEKQQRKQSLTLEARLRSAGLGISVRTFWLVSAGLGLSLSVMMLAVHATPLIALAAGFVGGLGLPRWAIGVLSKRRIKKFSEEFPNAMDVIVRGIKSGLPIHDCLKVIATESPQPLANEFQNLIENMGMGLTIEQGLEKIYVRMPVSELRFFTIVLAIQSKTGGNLAEALGNLSAVLRARKLMREKIKAMSGEAVASAAIIGALPPAIMLLVLMVTPSYMMPMFTDQRGHMMLLASGTWMGMGIFVMRRMINFKF